MIKTFFSYCGKNKAASWRLRGSGLLLVQFLVVPTIESTSPSVPWLFEALPAGGFLYQSRLHMSVEHFFYFVPEIIILCGLCCLLIFSAIFRLKFSRRAITLQVYLYVILLQMLAAVALIFSIYYE